MGWVFQYGAPFSHCYIARLDATVSDFYVEHRRVAYTLAEQPATRVDVLSKLKANIQDVFNEYGVQIMSPHYEKDPNEPHVVTKYKWHAAPAGPPPGEAASER